LKLLLDSHILLWWTAGDRRLGARAERILSTPDNELYVSAASWWELGLKQAAGRLRLDMKILRLELQNRRFVELPVTSDHADVARDLTRHHTDPFDHMLVAQATHAGLSLLTRDRNLKAYGPAVLHV
jgi:PIN domain nuclease of toxin-antitoxin system